MLHAHVSSLFSLWHSSFFTKHATYVSSSCHFIQTVVGIGNVILLAGQFSSEFILFNNHVNRIT